jgi:hypothetical protein
MAANAHFLFVQRCLVHSSFTFLSQWLAKIAQ